MNVRAQTGCSSNKFCFSSNKYLNSPLVLWTFPSHWSPWSSCNLFCGYCDSCWPYVLSIPRPQNIFRGMFDISILAVGLLAACVVCFLFLQLVWGLFIFLLWLHKTLYVDVRELQVQTGLEEVQMVFPSWRSSSYSHWDLREASDPQKEKSFWMGPEGLLVFNIIAFLKLSWVFCKILVLSNGSFQNERLKQLWGRK